MIDCNNARWKPEIKNNAWNLYVRFSVLYYLFRSYVLTTIRSKNTGTNATDEASSVAYFLLYLYFCTWWSLCTTETCRRKLNNKRVKFMCCVCVGCSTSDCFAFRVSSLGWKNMMLGHILETKTLQKERLMPVSKCRRVIEQSKNIYITSNFLYHESGWLIILQG